jgi:hypothetical protein
MVALGMQSILARRITHIAIIPSQRMLFMNAVNAGSHDPVATFGMARNESRKSFLLRFMEALKESRRREARRVIAINAHLLADHDMLDVDDQH